jgi:hypothetical protein
MWIMNIVVSDLPSTGIQSIQSAAGRQPQRSGAILANVDDSKRNAAGKVALDAIMSKIFCCWVKPFQELVTSYPKHAGMIFEERVNIGST